MTSYEKFKPASSMISVYYIHRNFTVTISSFSGIYILKFSDFIKHLSLSGKQTDFVNLVIDIFVKIRENIAFIFFLI